MINRLHTQLSTRKNRHFVKKWRFFWALGSRIIHSLSTKFFRLQFLQNPLFSTHNHFSVISLPLPLREGEGKPEILPSPTGEGGLVLGVSGCLKMLFDGFAVR